MGKFKTSLDLFKRSLSVVAQNKTLLLFPVIALVFICIMILIFISPFVLGDTGHALTEPAHWKALADQMETFAEEKDITAGVTGLACFAAIYLISIFLATFFNVAFYNEILQALNGNQVSIARGIGVARTKIRLILIWSVFAGVVGMIIKTLEDKLSFVGQWVVRLIGITWSVATIFIIPIIIREEKTSNPLNLLKTSALMLKRTWGESVIGIVGLASIFIAGLLASIPLFIIVLIIVGETIPKLWALFAILLLFFISMLAFACLYTAATEVYRCALYVYASEGVVPGPFDEEIMNRVWKVKAARKE